MDIQERERNNQEKANMPFFDPNYRGDLSQNLIDKMEERASYEPYRGYRIFNHKDYLNHDKAWHKQQYETDFKTTASELCYPLQTAYQQWEDLYDWLVEPGELGRHFLETNINKDSEAFWAEVLAANNDVESNLDVPIILESIIQTNLVHGVSTAQCERGISVSGFVWGKRRQQMGIPKTESVLHIRLNGKDTHLQPATFFGSTGMKYMREYQATASFAYIKQQCHAQASAFDANNFAAECDADESSDDGDSDDSIDDDVL